MGDELFCDAGTELEIRISLFSLIDCHIYSPDLSLFEEKRLDGRYAAGAEEEKETSKKADSIGCFIFCAACPAFSPDISG